MVLTVLTVQFDSASTFLSRTIKYCFEQPFKPNFEILEKSFNDWKIKKNRMFKFDLNSKLKPDHETTVLNGF